MAMTNEETIADFIDEKAVRIVIQCQCGEDIELELPVLAELAEAIRSHNC